MSNDCHLHAAIGHISPSLARVAIRRAVPTSDARHLRITVSRMVPSSSAHHLRVTVGCMVPLSSAHHPHVAVACASPFALPSAAWCPQATPVTCMSPLPWMCRHRTQLEDAQSRMSKYERK